ncbi:MAG: hypothetical protein NZ822_02540 [Patescibacteria group bacterium]|nr:hypothetical protein [Patescibacteria group bacterium]
MKPIILKIIILSLAFSYLAIANEELQNMADTAEKLTDTNSLEKNLILDVDNFSSLDDRETWQTTLNHNINAENSKNIGNQFSFNFQPSFLIKVSSLNKDDYMFIVEDLSRDKQLVLGDRFLRLLSRNKNFNLAINDFFRENNFIILELLSKFID